MDLGKTHNRVIPQTMSFAQGMKICFFVFLVNCSLISNSRISAEWFVLTLAGQTLDFHCVNVRGYDRGATESLFPYFPGQDNFCP